MAFLFIGYFPKQIEPAIAAMQLPGVREVWSVSHCISAAPDRWIQRWQHNAFDVYDTRALATSVIPESTPKAYVVLAYRLWREEFLATGTRPLAVPAEFVPPELEPDYRSLGYDVVSASCGSFECSPLSCNGGAKEFPVNARCLFDSLAEALRAAAVFAGGAWEPGPYRVVEVLAPEAALS